MTLTLFIIFVILQALDIWSTYRALTNDCHEAKAAMAWMIAHLGLLPGLIISKLLEVAVVGVAAYLYPSVGMTVALGCICAYYIAVVVNNFRLVK